MSDHDSSQAWNARYGMSDAILAAALNPVLKQLMAHASARSYSDRALPADVLPTLIAAAQSASSSSNLQVWSVVAIEDPERRARLAQLAGNQPHVKQVPLFLVWLADLARLERQAQLHQATADGLNYLESMLVGVIDTSLAAQNAVVALESMGLAGVYIGGIRNDIEGVARELGLPPRVFPIFGMCVGYANPERPAAIKPRLPQAAVLHREVYDLASQDGEVARYDRIMQEFYQQQGMSPSEWSRHSVDRVATGARLQGREHLVAVLKRMGFDLR
jgi:nitroreductase